MLGCVQQHRAALAVDFQTRYGLRLREFVEGASWNELWELVAPLLVDPYSHVVADAMGWTRPPDPMEEAAWTLMDFYRAAHRKKNAPQLKPLDRPWRTPREGTNGPSRSASEKATGRRRLQERLGLAPVIDK